MFEIDTWTILSFLLAVASGFNQEAEWNSAGSFHEFHALDLQGNDVSLEKYRGHVVVAFNGATRCPVSAKSFKMLQELQLRYPDLRVVTFIVDGLTKESGTDEEIREYIAGINVPFDVYGKIVSDGDDAHPVYKWMKSQLPNQEKIKVASKVLIDKHGKVVGIYPPTGPLTELEETMKKYF